MVGSRLRRTVGTQHPLTSVHFSSCTVGRRERTGRKRTSGGLIHHQIRTTRPDATARECLLRRQSHPARPEAAGLALRAGLYAAATQELVVGSFLAYATLLHTIIGEPAVDSRVSWLSPSCRATITARPPESRPPPPSRAKSPRRHSRKRVLEITLDGDPLRCPPYSFPPRSPPGSRSRPPL